MKLNNFAQDVMNHLKFIGVQNFFVVVRRLRNLSHAAAIRKIFAFASDLVNFGEGDDKISELTVTEVLDGEAEIFAAQHQPPVIEQDEPLRVAVKLGRLAQGVVNRPNFVGVALKAVDVLFGEERKLNAGFFFGGRFFLNLGRLRILNFFRGVQVDELVAGGAEGGGGMSVAQPDNFHAALAQTNRQRCEVAVVAHQRENFRLAVVEHVHCVNRQGHVGRVLARGEVGLLHGAQRKIQNAIVPRVQRNFFPVAVNSSDKNFAAAFKCVEDLFAVSR